jgi:hypothetical protein
MEAEPAPATTIAKERRQCAGCQAELPVDMLAERDGGWWCRGCLAATLPPAFPAPDLPVGWRAVVAELDLRRIAGMSARGGAYIAMVAAMAWLRAEPHALVYGVLTGIYSADNVTWLVRRFTELPVRVATFSIEAAIALLSGGVILVWQGAIIVPEEPQALGVSFVTFLLGLVAFTLVRFARSAGNDDSA